MARTRHVLTALALAGLLASGPAPATAGVAASVGADAGSVLVRFAPGVSPARAQLALQDLGIPGSESLGPTGWARVGTGGLPVGEVLDALRADPRVAAAEPNYLVRMAADPNDTMWRSGKQPYLKDIRLPKAWDRTKGMVSAKIAIIDTGVDLNHPDLASKLAPGYDFANDDGNPSDDNGHGTMVAGIAAAVTNNKRGIAGVAWKATILPVKVLDASGSGTVADVAAGITWATDQGARVVNLSLTTPGDSQAMHDAVDYAIDNDVVVVAAAGNESTTDPRYPAAYDGVIAVSALGTNGAIASFSNRGPWIDLCARGVDVRSTYLGRTEQYAIGSGTSFASPLVAGVAMLARSEYPSMTGVDIVTWLEHTAKDLGSKGSDNLYGYGRVDALGATGGPLPKAA